ncbi:PAS domain S-box protein, partial [Paracraurococcus ruber]|uniref:PAS domain S-box protein n=1 Tax=Paracraurococcus ruber TaxID=77675 RepID=UPI00105785EC
APAQPAEAAPARLRLSWLLLGLVLAVLVPALGVGAAAAWQAAGAERAAAEMRLRETARGLALAIDRDIGGVTSALLAFTTSPAFRAGKAAGPDVAALHDQAREIARQMGAHLYLARRDGTRLLTTRAPLGAPLPAVNSRALVDTVFATGGPALGDLVTGSVSNSLTVSVGVPVFGADGMVACVLGASLAVDRLQRLLAAQGLPEGTFAAVSDARDMLVARSDARHAALVGTPLPSSGRAMTAGAQSGLYRGLALDGMPRVFGFHRVAASPGWLVVVAQPVAAFDAAWRRMLGLLAAGGALALALGGALALLAARGILRPVARLGQHAEALADGRPAGPHAAAAIPPAAIAELEALRRGFAEAEAAVAAREAEREALFAASPVGLLSGDAAGRVHAANDALLRILGQDRAALLEGGVRWDAPTPPEWRAADARAIAEAMAAPDGVCQPYAKEFLWPDGTRVPVLVSFAMLDRRAGEVAAFVVDLTELRRQEAAVAASEARFRTLVEASGPIVFRADAVGRLLAAPGWTQLTGQAEAALRDGGWLRRLHPGDRRAVAAACRDAVAGATPLRTTFRVRTRGGAWRWMEGYGVPVRDAAGGVAEWIGTVADIHDRHLAEAALQESEARFRSLADNAPTMIWTTDAAGHCTWLSRQWCEFTGQREADGLGLGWLDAVHPEDRQRAADAFQTAARSGAACRVEIRLRRAADGGWAWVIDAAMPRPGPDGGPVGFVGSALDITERKEAEARLALSEARFRAAVQAVQGILWTNDAEGRMAGEQPGWAALTGQAPEEYQGHGWAQAVHPEDAQPTLAAWRAAVAAGAPFVFEHRVRRHDGAWRRYAIRAVPVQRPDGTTGEWVGVHTDVTEQRGAEAALAEGEARLRLAVQSARIGIWELDLLQRRWRLDARAVAVTGAPVPPDTWTAAQTDPTRSWFARIHPEDAPAREAAHQRVLSGEADRLESEYRVRQADGSWRWISQQAMVVERVAGSGAPARLVGVTRDVTVRRDLLAELERLVEERTAALRRSEARLAEAARMEALGRLAGGIAHDFNNVLQAVQGGIALGAKRLRRDPDGALRFLDMAAESTERGAAVTSRLLSFARRGELAAAPVLAAPLLENLAEMLRHTLGPGVALRVAVEPDTPPLLADAGQLDAVLVNLANNARDAMPSGSGAILLSAAPAAAPGGDAPAALAPGDYVRLSVADDGAGMPPEVLARVTEPFFTTKPKGKGTGLGLAMARGFAEQSGGGIAIASRPGRGTTVSLWLPRAAAAPAPEASAAPPLPAGGVAAALLLVDDEPAVRAVLGAGLAAQGFQVTEAEGAAAALDWLEAGGRPDAMVTDLAMPGGVDGLGLLQAARRRLPGLPAVLITGHAGDAAQGALQAAAAAGPFAVLRKPAAAEAVAAQVVTVLRGSPPAEAGREAGTGR